MDRVPTMAGDFIGVPLTPHRMLPPRIPVSLWRFSCGLYRIMLQSCVQANAIDRMTCRALLQKQISFATDVATTSE